MYKLSIIAVGALKEPFWKEAVLEYEKRLRPFAKVKLVEVTEIKDKNIPKDAFMIALEVLGKEKSSEEFAELLKREGETGREIVFLIGGPHGLDPELSEKCDAKISMSKFTFTHGEARAVLYEQLYRAMTILSGKTYHY